MPKMRIVKQIGSYLAWQNLKLVAICTESVQSYLNFPHHSSESISVEMSSPCSSAVWSSSESSGSTTSSGISGCSAGAGRNAGAREYVVEMLLAHFNLFSFVSGSLVHRYWTHWTMAACLSPRWPSRPLSAPVRCRSPVAAFALRYCLAHR